MCVVVRPAVFIPCVELPGEQVFFGQKNHERKKVVSMFSKAALSNVTVLDLTRVLAGPFCSMLFADMGANVIKIENPKEGADERKMGPFQERRERVLHEPEQEQEGRSR
jgi:hypothetical protein